MRKTGIALTLTSALVMAVGLAGCGGGGGGNDNPGGTRAEAGRASVTAVRGIRGAAVRLQAFGGQGGRSVKIPTRAAFAAKVTRQSEPREFDHDYGLWSEFVVDQSNPNAFRTDYYRDQFGGSRVGFIATSFTGTGLSIQFNVPEGLEPSVGTLTIQLTSETTGRLTGDIEDLATNEVSVFDLTFTQVGTDNFGDPIYRITGNMRYRDEEGAEFRYDNLVIEPNGSIACDVNEEGLTGRMAMNVDGSGQFLLNAEDGQYICQWDANGAGFIQYPDGFREDISDFDTIDEDEFDF